MCIFSLIFRIICFADIGTDSERDGIFFASESKSFVHLADVDSIKQFPPGSTWTSAEPNRFAKWFKIENYESRAASPDMICTEEAAVKQIRDDLVEATRKRLMSDRKIATFLRFAIFASLNHF